MLISGSSFDVFIAYNSADRPKVKEIVDLIKQEGIKPWYDQDISLIKTWVSQLDEAMPKFACAIFMIGPNGIGDWQEEEVKKIHSYMVKERKIPVILVFLPGDQPEPQIFKNTFSFEPRLHLREPIKNCEEFNKLIEAIHESIINEILKRTFEIEIDVKDPNRRCFLSIPENGYDDIFNLVKRTFENIKNIKLLQNYCRNGNEDTFTSDNVFQVTRQSETIIAVCIPETSQDNPSPEVLYELGLAQALGKPGIVINSIGQNIQQKIRPSIVKAQPRLEFLTYDPNDNNKFTTDLKTAIDNIVCSISEPYLIYPDTEGIHTNRSDIAYMKSSFWSSFCTILSFGVETLKNFSEIIHQSHILLSQVEALFNIKAENLRQGNSQPDEAFKIQHMAFHKVCKAILDNQEKLENNYLSTLDESKAKVKVAFEYLNFHLLEDLKKNVENSQKQYNIAFEEDNCFITIYQDDIINVKKLISTNTKDSSQDNAKESTQEKTKENYNVMNTWRIIDKEYAEIKDLTTYLKLIEDAIHKMIIELLKNIIKCKN